MTTFIMKPDVRSCDKITDCIRHQNLPWLCHRCDTRCNVDRDAAQIIIGHFDLAGMKAGPYLQPKSFNAFIDRQSASD